MKKFVNLAILVLVLAAVFTLGACGSGQPAQSPQTESVSYEPRARAEHLDMVGGELSRLSNTASAENTISADRRIIRNASLDIRTPDAASLYRSIVDYGTALDGYEHSYSMSTHETFVVIRAEFKVPPENLSFFIQFIGESGNVTHSSMSSEDITEAFFDAQTRLGTMRRTLERYYELLAAASGIEEIVHVQRIIDEITLEIESLEGRLNVWNSMTNMATVNLVIRQDNDPLQIRREINWNTLSFGDMGYLIRHGFISVTNVMASALQWLAIILIGYSPLWILLAAGIFLRRVLKKRNNAQKALVSEEQGPEEPGLEKPSFFARFFKRLRK